MALRAVGAVVGFTLAVAGALSGGAPGPLDRDLYDAAVSRLLPQVTPVPDLVVLEVDDRTLDALGERWPLSRATWARVFNRLGEHGPSAVAVDILFDQPGPQDALELGEEVLSDLRASGLTEQPAGAALAERLEAKLRARDEDARLAESLSQAGNVLLGSMALTSANPFAPLSTHARPEPLRLGGAEELRLHGQDVVGSLAPLLVSARGTGTLNMLVDPDGTIRRYPYVVGTPGEVHASLALATALRLMPERAESLVRTSLDGDQGAPLMRLPATGWLPRLSVVDVLTAKPGDAELDRALRGKVVFVGVTAAGLHGQVTLPGQVAVPGVEIHAFALQNLRTGTFMRSAGLPAAVGLVETALVLAALVLLGGRTRSLRQVLLVGAGLLALHGAFAFALAAGPGWVVPVVPGALGLGLVLLLETGLRIAELKQQRGALRRLFVRYPHVPVPEAHDTGSPE
jgi:CHASE2 domain-containing sensor protein